jgi:serine/threonine-protein kinase
MTTEFAIRTAVDIAEALTHAHSLGVIHRDLKPENIKVTLTDHDTTMAKVLDFGLARIFAETRNRSQDQPQSRLTQLGEVFGTPAYMAPEQARGSLRTTKAVDWYAFGIILFEMFEGDVPFWAESLADTLIAQVRDPLPEQRSTLSPEPIKQLIRDLTIKHPRERLSNGQEVLEILAPYAPVDPMSFSRPQTSRPAAVEFLPDAVLPSRNRSRRSSSFHGPVAMLFESEAEDDGTEADES